MAQLRQASNPFTFSVATAGTEERCQDFDVRDLFDSQRADLKAIVDQYRKPGQPSQVFPILGAPGAGKTHLLHTFQAELNREAAETGRECLLVVADHFSPGLDAIDFFCWQVVNHLLAHRGAGSRMLRVLSDRLTARLLGEALRRLSPPAQVRLIPPNGWWEGICLRWDNSRAAERRLVAVRGLLACCDNQTPSELRRACQQAGIPLQRALEAIQTHLEQTESKDVAGILRQNLYFRLAQLTLLNEREPLEDFLTEEYREGPQHVVGAGQLPRRLLSAFLELFRELEVPAVLVFDQLEDFLVGSTPDRVRELRETFSRSLAALVNNVPGLCLLVFAEQGLWNETILGHIDQYARQRLSQPFSLPGRPARDAILMPDQIDRAFLEALIERRVRSALGDFDSTGLSRIFPFQEEHLQQLKKETTVRSCLRKLAEWFDQAVHPQPSVGPTSSTQVGEIDQKLLDRLRARWQTALVAARTTLKNEDQYSTALIPEIQSALNRWLTYLLDLAITGSGSWSRVELLDESATLGLFGYLNVIRLETADLPGIGIAAWMGERKWRLIDLQRRLEFFNRKPCPIRTLVLFRHDGEEALNGATRETYEQARKRGARPTGHESRAAPDGSSCCLPPVAAGQQTRCGRDGRAGDPGGSGLRDQIVWGDPWVDRFLAKPRRRNHERDLSCGFSWTCSGRPTQSEAPGPCFCRPRSKPTPSLSADWLAQRPSARWQTLHPQALDPGAGPQWRRVPRHHRPEREPSA